MKGCTAGFLLLVSCFAQNLLATATASAQTASSSQRLYGVWYTYPLGNPNTDSIRHEFRRNAANGKDEMIVTHICQGDNTAVIARAAAPIEISQDTIKILKSVSHTEKQSTGADCQATIDAAVWGYTISDTADRISITNPGGVPDLFQLARQDPPNDAAATTSIYGTWAFPVQRERGTNIQIKLVFYDTASTDRGKVRQISACSKGTDSLKSQVDAQVRVTKNEITILEDASHEQLQGPFSCMATISAGTLHYAISADGQTMVLSKAGGPSLTLTREQ